MSLWSCVDNARGLNYRTLKGQGLSDCLFSGRRRRGQGKVHDNPAHLRDIDKTDKNRRPPLLYAIFHVASWQS